MALARWQSTIVDDEGNVLSGASVEVREEITGSPLAVLFSDRAGTVGIGNPVSSDAEGYAFFHVPGGAYRITVTSGSFTRTHRYVAVGLAAETDGAVAGVGYLFDSDTADADPGNGSVRFNHATPASATKLFISQTAANETDVGTWLATWDDSGISSDRGALTIQSSDGSAALVAKVTGSVTDDGAYYDVPITVQAATAAGTFIDGMRLGVSFVARGVDGTNGTGTVNGPAANSPGVTAGELVVFGDGTGANIDGSGKTISTVGAGKQSLWIPADSMRPRATTPAGSATFDSGSNDITIGVLDFDQTTSEFAHFNVAMPKQWDEQTVTFVPYWTAGAGTAAQTAIVTLAGVAISNDDPLNAVVGAAASSSDALIATGDLHIGPESAPITIGGTPAESDLVVFQVSRDVTDTLAADLRLIGIVLFITTNANTDV